MEFAFAQRFASAFGTPNVATPAHICGSSASGRGPSPWAPVRHRRKNLSAPHRALGLQHDSYKRQHEERESSRRADQRTKLVVIDPKQIDIAKRADLWISPKPGSDGALALGFLKVIIEEGLYDKNFVEQWTVGFHDWQPMSRRSLLKMLNKQPGFPSDRFRSLPDCTLGPVLGPSRRAMVSTAL